MPKISVVIPAYNAMTYLSETLDSVLSQAFIDFEVLIINDGSTDHIVSWASEITDPRVRLISQENKGLPGARNTGITYAQGEYIAFLDADDLWDPSKLKKQVDCFEKNPEVGLVYTWTTLIDSSKRTLGIEFNWDLEGRIWEQMLVTDVVGNGSSAMVRRACFNTVGNFDTSLTSVEDWDMWIRIAKHYPFAVVKEYLTLYRQHPNSMSKNRQKILHNLHTVIEKAFAAVPAHLLYLKKRTYGHMNYCQAWVAMYAGDHKQAIHFRQQALLYDPHIRYTKSFLNLNLGILLVQLFGSDGYIKFKNFSRALRHHILKTVRPFSLSS
ncbi:glycosyltransferase family A protein [Nostoc sp. UHCC 0251]|uniref:glycosyltransferase family 2 protein n=1 Tax=Nostoc sp. UHCC 0251 TaxID=3110240 RepID=UPI002B21E712|nr:glycosyltransferase family A protein [Nostoc sp. UHCC 0251]MEA5622625.1 glycosyltransferase family A protein [Nostoc sp. UHCC 0251]